MESPGSLDLRRAKHTEWRMKDVMTTREVAEILRVHPYTVNSLIRSGKLKAFKISNRYRVRRADLEEFMESEETSELSAE